MKTLFMIISLMLVIHVADDLHDHKDYTHKTSKTIFTKTSKSRKL